MGVSLADTESGKPVGIINDYISLASGCLGEKNIEFQLTGFDFQEEELQALKDSKIDMIFHMNQNPYEAEQLFGVELRSEADCEYPLECIFHTCSR